MAPPDLSISKIGPDSDLVLRNLFEFYVHDMTEWFDIDTKADGSFSYDTSLIWKNGDDAYLAKVGESIAGFALIGPAVGDSDAQDVREFFVLRKFRRSGIGRKMATLVWDAHPGEWLVRVLELNAPAVLFWRAAIESQVRGSYEEELRIVNGRQWRFFRFVSH
jgi:predicted acetyltransferase